MHSRHALTFAALFLAAAVAVALAALLRGDVRPAAAGGAAGLGFSPPASTIAGATPEAVDLTLTNAGGVAGYEAWIAFNGAVVHLNSLTDAGFLANPNPSGTPQNTVVCTTPTVTASYGHLACNVLTLPPPFPPPVLPSAGSTPVSLVHSVFSAAGTGTSPLSLTAVASGTPQTTLLLDANSTPIPATLGSGSVTVGGTPTSGVPASVGGFAELPQLAAAPPDRAGAPPVALLAIVAGSLLAVALATLLYARRRADSR